jgi:general secretion pathway protein K
MRLPNWQTNAGALIDPNRGIVLIALLWVLAALSLLALDLASTVRAEVNMTQASGEAEKSYFYAQGGLEEVLFHVVFPYPDIEKQRRLFPYAGGMNHYWTGSGEMRCHIAIQDEAGKIDLNFASQEVLTRLLENLGVAGASSIAASIVEWRKPSSERKDFDGIKHRPFASVEELLLIRGMSREILYGKPQTKEHRPSRGRRGLAEFVTVYSGKSQININYAEPEVIAALPGLNLEMAELIVQARARQPFKTSSELSQRVTGVVSGETLSLLTTEVSQQYCLIATAQVSGSKVRRSIKLIIKRSDKFRTRHEKLMWYDEYWPSEEVLQWTERQLAV